MTANLSAGLLCPFLFSVRDAQHQDFQHEAWICVLLQLLRSCSNSFDEVPDLGQAVAFVNGQVIEQVWFAGVHSEVGGGCGKDRCSFSHIPFAWMMDKAYACGLRLRDDWRDGLNQNPHVDMHDSYVLPWRLLGPKRRKIGDNARIHQSVLDRRDQKVVDYAPPLPRDYSVVINDSYNNNP